MKPILTALMAFLLVEAGGQGKKVFELPDENKKFFLSVYGGTAFGGEQDMSGCLSLSYVHKENVFSVTVGGTDEFFLLFSPSYKNYWHFSVEYGRIKRAGKFILLVVAGAGIAREDYHENIGGGLFSDEPAHYEITSRSALNIPFRAEGLFIPKRFGIGIYAGCNINSLQSVFILGSVIRYRLTK